MARRLNPPRSAAAARRAIRVFPSPVSRSGAAPVTSGRCAVMKSGLPSSGYRRRAPIQRYGLRRSLVAVVMVLIAAPFSFLLFRVLAEGPLTPFDGDLADRFN